MKITEGGKPGDLAIIFDNAENKMIGIGLYDPASPIQIKMLHFGGPVKIDHDFFRAQILTAIEKRAQLLETDTNSFRLIFGENDGFPGLIADVYAKCLVVKLYSEAWLPWLEFISEDLIRISGCDVLVLRLSRLMKTKLEGKLSDGMIVYGHLNEETILFSEHGLHFSANVIKGHKTGYFLDHRHNRRRVGQLGHGRRVLDVFAYSGGFSVHALAGGATDVCSVDISAQALDQARINAALNPHKGSHSFIRGDAFKVLDQLISDQQKFDLVVIDPPSFAKRESEVSMAKRKYAELIDKALNLVPAGGVLVMASCSSRITSRSFFDLVETRIKMSGRSYDLMDRTLHDSDHHAVFPEGFYLKCAYYRLG